MKKRNDGQVSLASEIDEDIYKSVKRLCTKGIELGNDCRNWLFSRLLNFAITPKDPNLAWIYEMQKSSSGSILEFGVHFGSSFAQLINLRGIREPFNYSRHIYGFGHLRGFHECHEQR